MNTDQSANGASPDAAEIRAQVARSVKSLSDIQRRQYSQKLCQHIAQSNWLNTVQYLFIYQAMKDEIDPSSLEETARLKGICLAYPRTSPDGSMEFFTKPAAQPNSNRACTPDSKTLILLPGRAFCPGGHRIGRGRGYYDRYLQRYRASCPAIRTLGIAFSLQIFPSLPQHEGDQSIDAVCTENGFLGYT
jgi:5-formyltetrahydrofolate cyclo-ligase